jgi:serine/threonine protein kinase
MKIIHKKSITCEEEKINALSERMILEAMDHPFIVKLHYAFQSERKLYLLCDLMSGVRLIATRENCSTCFGGARSFRRRWPSSTPPRSSWRWSTCTRGTSSTAT